MGSPGKGSNFNFDPNSAASYEPLPFEYPSGRIDGQHLYSKASRFLEDPEDEIEDVERLHTPVGLAAG